MHALLAVLRLGWDSDFEYYLLPLVPFMMFNDRARTDVVSAASGVVLATFVALRWMGPSSVVEERLTEESAVLADIDQQGGLLGAQTLTFGAASVATSASVDSYREAVDRALYRGKAGGRNSVVVAA